MVPSLEEIKGGGGSIKIGTTGTISALMSRELRTIKNTSPNPDMVLQPNEATVSTKLKARVQADKASSSSSSNTSNNNTNEKHETFQKTKRKTSRNPNRRKGSYIVEVVDIKCKMPDPITNRLKKLNFSKLSETNA